MTCKWFYINFGNRSRYEYRIGQHTVAYVFWDNIYRRKELTPWRAAMLLPGIKDSICHKTLNEAKLAVQRAVAAWIDQLLENNDGREACKTEDKSNT